MTNAISCELQDRLPPRGWVPHHRARLLQWLDGQGANRGRRCAVFDWDNTCVFHCFGEALFRTQLDQLRLGLDDEMFDLLLSPPLPHAADGLVGGAPLAHWRTDLKRAAEALRPWSPVRTEHPRRGSEAHQDFRARFAALYSALETAAGASVAYPWLIGTLGGTTGLDIEQLAVDAIHQALEEPIGMGRWETPIAGASGLHAFRFSTGVRPQREVQDLMALLEEVGIEVWVVTASLEGSVRAAAAELGYPVRADRVLGARLQQDARGRHSAVVEPADVHPFTNLAGKVEAIRRRIGVEPVLVAGDSNGDVAMLTAFAATRWRLIIDRRLEGPIAELKAAEDPRHLVQGRHEAQGIWHPQERSRPLHDELARA